MKAILVLFLLFTITSPGFSSEKINWLSSYDQALGESEHSGKPVFVDCFADWCVWCHILDDEVYSNPKVIRFLQNYIPLRIDIEDQKEGTRLAEQFRIEGLPLLLVIDSNGKLLNRISGFLDADALIADLTGIQKLIDLERNSPENLIAVKDLAIEYLSRDMHSDAEMRFQRLLDAPSLPPEEKEEAQFYLALSQYYQRDLESALKSLDSYRTKYPAGGSAEDALLLLSEIYLETDSNEKARSCLLEFLEKYPDSGNINRAREVLSLLDATFTQ